MSIFTKLFALAFLSNSYKVQYEYLVPRYLHHGPGTKCITPRGFIFVLLPEAINGTVGHHQISLLRMISGLVSSFCRLRVAYPTYEHHEEPQRQRKQQSRERADKQQPILLTSALSLSDNTVRQLPWLHEQQDCCCIYELV